MRTKSIEGWQDLALASASVFPSHHEIMVGCLHVGCQTETPSYVACAAFFTTRSQSPAPGVLQGCQDTIPTIPNYPFDHISFAHERLLLAALNMPERDRA